MTQASKVIDVTRSFIPVDPNAYPETMHGTDQEDSPEKRIPVVSYMGYNFLPTAHGYRSYFGINGALDIAALPPVNKPDFVFMFQTEAYVNYLIALCDTGIWIKNAATTGAWLQLKALTAPAEGVFAEWTFCTIKNKMYFFRNNNAVYYRLETDLAEVLGIKLYDVTPTFMTPATQLGMFRMGARLGFWDTNNAISWSSPDDLSDFKPAILTGANVTTFNSIVGKISAIRPHGLNILVYSSKSVIMLAIQPGETFLAKAIPILIGAGVPYMRQSIETVPDTIHFCYSNVGIYKIDNGKPEIIVPEVFDYFKGYTAQPVYLSLLQGRYLCFEILDPLAIAGKAQFTKKVIPPTSVTFAGSSVTLEDIKDNGLPEDLTICDILELETEDFFPEQKDAATSTPGYPTQAMRKPGTSVTPKYTCYLSDANGPQEIVWGSAPCGSAKVDGTGLFTPSPTGDGGKLSQWSTDGGNKTAKTGSQAWTDGKWTMQRFVQWQTSIWKTQEKAMRAFLTQLDQRTQTSTKTTSGLASCVPIPIPTPSECTIGVYPSEFSDHKFGFNRCSFWLTRYCLKKVTVKNQVSNVVACQITHTLAGPPTGWKRVQNGSTIATVYGSAGAAAAGFNYYAGTFHEQLKPATSITVSISDANNAFSTIIYDIVDGSGNIQTTPSGANGVIAVWSKGADGNNYTYDSAGTTQPLVLPTIGLTPAVNPNTKIENQTSLNVLEESAAGVWGVESAFCLLTHYEYVDTAGVKQTVNAGTCTDTSDKYPGNTNPDTGTRAVPQGDTRPVITNPQDGSVCSFDLADLEHVSLLSTTDWPDETITYPGTSFLVQVGSIAPKHATRFGLFVYDLHLRKWGKAKIQYKQLLDYSPANGGTNSPVNFDVFGILAGIMDANGVVCLFDNNPLDSQLTWGKIGYYRTGVTDLQTVRIDFATISKGSVEVQASLDGVSVAEELVTTQNFNGAKSVTIHPEYTGKWHNVTLKGRFDVSYIETIGMPKGRRI